MQLSDIEPLLGNINLNLTTKVLLIFPNSCNPENTKRPSFYVNILSQNLCGCDLSWDKQLLCRLKYSVSYGREDEFQPKININSTFWALAEGISGCSLIGSCLLVLAALLWLLTNGWRWCAWHFVANLRVLLLWAFCICWAVRVYICAPSEEQGSCIDTTHQSLQDEDVNNLHAFNWWGYCESSSSNTFLLLTVPGFKGQNLT